MNLIESLLLRKKRTTFVVLAPTRGSRNMLSVRMAPLKHGQQEELIRKWLRIGGEEEIEDHRVDGLERDVNLIIQENRIVPRFPFFVLSILQTYEALMPQRNGHYRHTDIVIKR